MLSSYEAFYEEIRPRALLDGRQATRPVAGWLATLIAVVAPLLAVVVVLA